MLKRLRKKAQIPIHLSVSRLISKTQETGSNLVNEKPAKDRLKMNLIQLGNWEKIILEKNNPSICQSRGQLSEQ